MVRLREVRTLRQFEIWWADLPKPAGRRPVLLLTRDDGYSYLNKFIVAEITTTIRHIPVEVQLGKRDGLSAPCAVNCDNLRTVRREVAGRAHFEAGGIPAGGSEARRRLCSRLGRTHRG